jgi:hypothetical protein
MSTSAEIVEKTLAYLGRQGGLARAASLSPERRSEIARKARAARNISAGSSPAGNSATPSPRGEESLTGGSTGRARKRVVGRGSNPV